MLLNCKNVPSVHAKCWFALPNTTGCSTKLFPGPLTEAPLRWKALGPWSVGKGCWRGPWSYGWRVKDEERMKKVHVDLDKMRWDVVRWLVVPPMSSSHQGGVSTSKTTWSSCFAYACVATAPPKGRIWIVKGTAAIHLGNWGLKFEPCPKWTPTCPCLERGNIWEHSTQIAWLGFVLSG